MKRHTPYTALFNGEWISLLCVCSQDYQGFLVSNSVAPVTAEIWRKELDLSQFLDDQIISCAAVPFYGGAHKEVNLSEIQDEQFIEVPFYDGPLLQSVSVLMTTTPFQSLQLRLWLQNLSPEPVTTCEQPLLVLTQTSELQMGRGDCHPFCGGLAWCDFVSKWKSVASATITGVEYSCYCQAWRCQNISIHIPRSALQYLGNHVGLCHAELSPSY